jgi:hypothetical protein
LSVFLINFIRLIKARKMVHIKKIKFLFSEEIRTPDGPARSWSLFRLRYTGERQTVQILIKIGQMSGYFFNL